MKQLLTLTALLLTINSNASNFECKFTKGWDRPVNANAIKLAKALKVKTCNSAKFQAYVKDNKHTTTPLVRNSNGGVKALKFN